MFSFFQHVHNVCHVQTIKEDSGTPFMLAAKLRDVDLQVCTENA